MNLTELKNRRAEILAIAADNGVSDIRVFGSVARGGEKKGSDVDLLVHFNPGAGWGYFGFRPEMEDLLGCKVDVVSDAAINPYIRENILKEAIPLFDV